MATAVRGGGKGEKCASGGEKRASGRKGAQTRGHQEVKVEEEGI